MRYKLLQLVLQIDDYILHYIFSRLFSLLYNCAADPSERLLYLWRFVPIWLKCRQSPSHNNISLCDVVVVWVIKCHYYVRKNVDCGCGWARLLSSILSTSTAKNIDITAVRQLKKRVKIKICAIATYTTPASHASTLSMNAQIVRHKHEHVLCCCCYNAHDVANQAQAVCSKLSWWAQVLWWGAR